MKILKFILIDLVVISILIAVNGVSLLPAVYLGAYVYECAKAPWALALVIPLCYFVYLLAYTIVNALFKRLLVGKLVCGDFDFMDSEAQRWRLNMLFTTTSENFCIANIKLITVLKFLYFRLLGSRIDFITVYAINGGIYEPELISFGHRSLTGMQSIVSGHVAAGSVMNLSVGPVSIGEACIIGARSIILNGTKIGNEVVVGTGAIVGKNVCMGDRSILLNNGCLLDGTVVGPGEIWGCVPARKIKDRE